MGAVAQAEVGTMETSCGLFRFESRVLETQKQMRNAAFQILVWNARLLNAFSLNRKVGTELIAQVAPSRSWGMLK